MAARCHRVLERQSLEPVGSMEEVKDLVWGIHDQIDHLPGEFLLDVIAHVIDADGAI
jgi:hypothetical protein